MVRKLALSSNNAVLGILFIYLFFFMVETVIDFYGFFFLGRMRSFCSVSRFPHLTKPTDVISISI